MTGRLVVWEVLYLMTCMNSSGREAQAECGVHAQPETVTALAETFHRQKIAFCPSIAEASGHGTSIFARQNEEFQEERRLLGESHL